MAAERRGRISWPVPPGKMLVPDFWNKRGRYRITQAQLNREKREAQARLRGARDNGREAL